MSTKVAKAQYARAYIGLASVYYIRALEPALQNRDPSRANNHLLNLAINTYEQALSASNQSPFADVPTKVSFGLGQCHLMKSFTNEDVTVERAIQEFQKVIVAYGNGTNPRVRELAAESHARLGLIYGLAGQANQAVGEYEAAASLLYDDPERQRLYLERAEELK